MAADDQRIAWLLTAEALECGDALKAARLPVAAEAGFRVVAMNHAMATGSTRPEIEAAANRLGMQCIVVDDAAHCHLASKISDAERWSLAQALSRDGFDGFILCEVCDHPVRAESLLATARVLLRDLDQIDWESYQ